MINNNSEETNSTSELDAQHVSNAQEVQYELRTQDNHDERDRLITPFTKENNSKYKSITLKAIPATETTQGKKGQKLPRINMAFSHDNIQYLNIISRIEGVSVTEYVNQLIAKDKSSRANEVEKAKSILKNINL